MKKKDIENLLKENDIRCTEQRVEILKVIARSDIPLTAAEIDRNLTEEGIDIRLSTIYRNLKLFNEKALIRQLNFSSDEKKYEILKEVHHQHLICIKCGKIKAIKCPLKEYASKIKEETNYEILNHDMELYGICPKCQKDNNNSN